ncbi:MAG: thioredoxin domain-containing protein [Sandaracinaceae bacterium]
MIRVASSASLRVLALVVFAACSSDPAPTAHLPEPSDMPEASWRSPAEVREGGNQLVGEPSPYLQQHDHNPVDWYPFGEAALERARALNRPLFVSVGYSTCHWCHVMEEESFENDEVAAFLNEHFVAIKIDRERRPDLDGLFMDAVAAMGGSTGWPLTIFLTPDLVPLYGGTYFPREGGHGRPGFMDVLNQVHRGFQRGGGDVARGRQILDGIARAARRPAPGTEPTPTLVAQAMQRLERARDRRRGGFGARQKFPNTPLLLAQLRYVQRTADAGVRAHLELTLDQAMRGGIRDHLGGAFHRYSVDPAWHVPHFEKMLYDNAQLAELYVEAGQALGRADFVAVGRGVLDELLAHWQTPAGGFVVGFDADDPEGEGAYYTWTPAELSAVLGPEDGTRFARLFAVTNAGERLLEGRSVLHRVSDAAARAQLQMEPAEVDAFVSSVRPRLLAARQRRPPPAMDDKALAAWNGLAIVALANVGRWLDEPRYVAAAQRAAHFVMDRLFVDGRMMRGRRGDASLGEGFLDDHALVALGLLRLHAADGDPAWLVHARTLVDAMVARFLDAETESFVQTARDDIPEGLPLRRPDLDDGVLPSGGTAAILALLEFGAMAGDTRLHGLGEQTLRRAAPRARQSPMRSGTLLVALEHALCPTREVVIAGPPEDRATQALFAVVRPTSPGRVLPVRVAASGASAALLEALPALRGKTALDGRPTAFVCEVGRCELPTSDPDTLRAQLP